MLSQTGVCLCTVQVGFASVCVCVFEAHILEFVRGVHGSFMLMSVFLQANCCSVVY